MAIEALPGVVTDTALAILRQFLLFCALLTPLELLLPARPGQHLRRAGSVTDMLYFALNPFLIKAGTALVFAALAAAIERLLPAALRAALRGQPGWLQFLEIFLLAELNGYLLHRASHRCAWLWRLHAVHHSNTHMDWLAAHRQHPLESILTATAANLPVLVLGFSLEPVLGFVLFQKIYTAFLHANVAIDYGPLSAVIASPRFHHWHHDAEGGARVGNYAAMLALLDRLFGTHRLPPGLPARYGIGREAPEGAAVVDPMPSSYLGQLLHPFRPR